MTKPLDLSQLETAEFVSAIDSATAPNRSYDPSYDPSHEPTANVAANKNLDGCERFEIISTAVDELLAIEIWKPAQPQYCKEICAHYDVTNRTVQKWFIKIIEACPWFSESELRLPDDRYTPLCIELMGDYHASGLIARKWGAKMAQRFVDRVSVAPVVRSVQAEAPAIRPDVLPPLPPIDRTAAGSLLSTGSSYLSALEEEEAELQQLETQELELLERMSSNLDRLNQNQSQWSRTNDLRRQRLLRQTRLEAAALATELEVEFEETLRESQHNIRHGNVGKSPATAAPSQSA